MKITLLTVDDRSLVKLCKLEKSGLLTK